MSYRDFHVTLTQTSVAAIPLDFLPTLTIENDSQNRSQENVNVSDT